MAKDDYDVILCRILIYFYACKKRKILFDRETFRKTVMKDVNEDYFTEILDMAQEEGFIKGLTIAKAWQGTYILASDIEEAEITAAGIRYLNENSRAKKVLQLLKDAAESIAQLAGLIGLLP